MAHTALHEVDQGGAFKRTESQFRNWIQPGGKFEPEPDRYHLYVSYACPWASRCIAVRAIKGLEDVIGLSVVHPTWGRTKPDVAGDEHSGWLFKTPGDAPFPNPAGKGSFDCDSALIPDSINNAKTIREVYELANDTHGKYSVPVLWDKELKTIVNNESSEIVQMFSKQFNQWAKKPDIDVCPDDLEALRKETINWVVPNISNGVYRCGFAQSQAAYDEACTGLYAHLDKAEEILSRQRYLCGSRFTDADLFLFVTLIRFDEVYVAYFRTCKKLIREYPNLFNFVKDVYQIPGVAGSVNMKHIKTHYFTSHPHLNAFAIVPQGPGIDYLSAHDRNRF